MHNVPRPAEQARPGPRRTTCSRWATARPELGSCGARSERVAGDDAAARDAGRAVDRRRPRAGVRRESRRVMSGPSQLHGL